MNANPLVLEKPVVLAPMGFVSGGALAADRVDSVLPARTIVERICR